jgi:hypothetical protein
MKGGCWYLNLKRNHLQEQYVSGKICQRIGLFPVDNGALDFFRGLFVFSLFSALKYHQPVLHEGRPLAVEGYPSQCNDGLF